MHKTKKAPHCEEPFLFYTFLQGVFSILIFKSSYSLLEEA